MVTNSELTQSELKRLVSYDSNTGVFRWKAKRSGVLVGDVCGKVDRRGYLRITIKGKLYGAANLAFLYMAGNFPNGFADHISRNRLDNSWSNLRDVSHAENQKNKGIPKNNTSGIVGVRWDSKRGNWIAQIGVSGKKITLGRFKEVDDAIAAREQATAKYGYHETHGKRLLRI